MIQDFKTYIGEGTLWGNTIMRSDTDKVRKEDEITEEYVRSFIKDTFQDNCEKVIIRKENGKQVVDIIGNVVLKDDIEELPFQFGVVEGYFYCSSAMVTLKGCPRKLKRYGGFMGNFWCDGCINLTSLEGCPEEIDDDFYCAACGKQFTKKEVRKYCNVNGKVYV